MPNLLSARSRGRLGRGEDDGDGVGVGIGNRACYGISACAVALLLFCALAAKVSVWMAFAFGGLALLAFGAAGCLAPAASWRVGPGDGVSADNSEGVAADAAGAARARRLLGMSKAAISALPTFAYALDGGEGGDGADLESGVGCEPCSVCLEDVQAGEMVRQLPSCKHLFHVECIDMWLHSHRTCPVCRCNLLPPSRKVAAKAAAAVPLAEAEAEAEREASAEVALPPV